MKLNKVDKSLITINNPKSVFSESFRTMRTNIEYANIDNKIKTILVTSSLMSEGKSTILSNLAVVFAMTSKRVLVVDTDLRKPKIHRVFNISNKKGLTNYLINYDKDKIDDYIFPIKEQKNLYVMPSGTIPPNPSELLGSERMETFIKDVSQKFDLVLFDTPPIGVVTDSAVLARNIDGVVFVVGYDNAKRDFVCNAKSLLDNVDANIIVVTIITIHIAIVKKIILKVNSFKENLGRRFFN